MENSTHPRVIVGIDRTLAGYAALRLAVGIARGRRLPLQAVRASAGVASRDAAYIDQAFQEALGGIPLDLEVTKTIVYEPAASGLARNAADPRDVIVVGNDATGALRVIWPGTVGRGLFKRARCQVLVVPAPEMHRPTRRSLRRLRRRRADVWNRFEAEAPEPRGTKTEP
jgi:hypothetical protein